MLRKPPIGHVAQIPSEFFFVIYYMSRSLTGIIVYWSVSDLIEEVIRGT